MRKEIIDYMRERPKCQKIIMKLSSLFEVTFATDRKLYNAEFYVLFLKPSDEIKNSFGMHYEILSIYSPFPVAQPRLAQAVEKIINDEPAKGRVDRIVVLTISDDPNIKEWERRYSIDHPDSRIMIPANSAEIINSKNSSAFIRSLLQERLYHANLFDYRLPLNTDAFYFGRSHELAGITSAIDRGENVGIFGLRKTGKTSFLFKVQRVLHDSGLSYLFYYDCKQPELRSLNWVSLLGRICMDISNRLEVKWKQPVDQNEIIKLFKSLISRSKKRIVLAFDEIEFISPNAVLDVHWERDFVDFWQTIWGVQSQQRKLVAVISGVIPKVIETERYSGVQNPLFSIVKAHFLRGFNEKDVGVMVNTMGEKVGIQFDQSAIEYLVKRYGGHPYLIRLACSNLLENLDSGATKRPFKSNLESLTAAQEARERQLLPYVRHIVAELRDFYPAEYEVLELLSTEQYKEYYEFAAEPEFVEHLKEYGIVSTVDGHDEIAIPVAKKFIATEYRRRRNIKSALEPIPKEERENWLRLQSKAILAGMRQLADHFRKTKKMPFLPVGGVPEADRFISAPVANNEHSFTSFIMVANRCLVESIEAFMKERGYSSAIYEQIPKILPKLSNALQRTKVYRHEAGHLELSDPKVILLREKFLSEDFNGRQRSSFEDPDFILQQSVIENLMNSIQAELVANRLV
ncbi:AAA-like domain-containing protein [Xanthomonas arboricola]|uniref:AAA-like domain-containing protein n=1 Tax=Xanthomonas arboricola TaxID=56448 RepID=UPI000C8600AE|nr:AAA-like domain-containing protein [Xanthomonas arboricola]PPT21144.1 hypothetical protein XarCFBP6771_09535 [Xanthomonas arboricola]SOU08991.1 hypothetical protein LMG19145_00073 [Xanthomonas arboricola pv. fragariae]